MSYNGRQVFAQSALAAGWEVIENMFVQDAPIVVEFDFYRGGNGNSVLIGWDENNCAPYVGTKTANDPQNVKIVGMTALIQARDFIESNAVAIA